ncbi:MAG TPA: endolytic transglycosylase MltG [Candidatus Krumholzibacteria bacterium]|nr:endolytic transglycosylase MltG [Candidatus Krumholzibacteria bacterium]HPD71063.1 endolytic transglycosylase MltG [Candidatus Krumholzibacteria bacterium]HRY39237.1 endolytic transglycosylase MltG [Candidatus Krumholzibacteria bacterium]
MKRAASVAAAAVALAGVVLAVAAWRVWDARPDPPPAAPATILVRVAPGATLRSVAADLHGRGLLAYPRLWLIVARLTGRDRALQVGRYAISPGASPRELLAAFLAGRPLPVVVTLPEGQEAPVLAAVLADSLGLAAGDILACADSLVTARLDSYLPAAARSRLHDAIAGNGRPAGRLLHWCEGYLAPDTYHFAEGTDAFTVARTVVGLQFSRLDSVADLRDPIARDYSLHELLSLASIVEAEARRPPERALIAAVYHNRLRRGMRLEADPTVGFWLGKRGERLLYQDLEVDSPYNTYRRAGLPVGPIGCPGLAALVAAARPDPSCRALYFVADGDGGHVFSRTLAEHEDAVHRYRGLMRGRRR